MFRHFLSSRKMPFGDFSSKIKVVFNKDTLRDACPTNFSTNFESWWQGSEWEKRGETKVALCAKWKPKRNRRTIKRSAKFFLESFLTKKNSSFDFTEFSQKPKMTFFSFCKMAIFWTKTHCVVYVFWPMRPFSFFTHNDWVMMIN